MESDKNKKSQEKENQEKNTERKGIINVTKFRGKDTTAPSTYGEC